MLCTCFMNCEESNLFLLWSCISVLPCFCGSLLPQSSRCFEVFVSLLAVDTIYCCLRSAAVENVFPFSLSFSGVRVVRCSLIPIGTHHHLSSNLVLYLFPGEVASTEVATNQYQSRWPVKVASRWRLHTALRQRF